MKPWVWQGRGVLGFCLGAWLALAGGMVKADVIIVPSQDANVEGNFNNGFPFDISVFGISSQRYQQVYAASEFASLAGPQLITQIGFRPDAFFGSAFSSTLPNIRIDLSTTSASPGTLSNAFANNVGADDKVVFSGPVSLSSADTGPAGGPKNFDIFIPLQTPFLYDPSKGDLLLDVRNFSGGFTTFFDADFTPGGTIARTYSLVGVNDTVGDGPFFSGLVTRFDTQPVTAVPEPGTWALFSVGVLGLIGSCRRRRKALPA
jgi:PEP-CTERM motif